MGSTWNAGTDYGLYGRTNEGWKFAGNGPITVPTQGFNVYCIEQIRSVWHAGTSNGLYALGAGGWSQVASSVIGNTPVRCLTIVDGLANVGTDKGIFFRQNGAWIFAQNGPGAAPVYCIGVDPNGDPFAGTKGGLFALTKSGWLPPAKRLDPSLAVRSFGVVAGVFYAGTSGGLFGYRSKKDGWYAVTGVPNTVTVHTIKQFPGGDAYLGTDNGVYRLEAKTWVNMDGSIDGIAMPYTAYCLDYIGGNLSVGTKGDTDYKKKGGVFYLSKTKWVRDPGISHSVSVLCLKEVKV